MYIWHQNITNYVTAEACDVHQSGTKVVWLQTQPAMRNQRPPGSKVGERAHHKFACHVITKANVRNAVVTETTGKARRSFHDMDACIVFITKIMQMFLQIYNFQ